jgi:hypothetical protein
VSNPSNFIERRVLASLPLLKYKVEKTFIDGVGVGGGVVDRLKQMGFMPKIVEVSGAHTPNKPLIYANKRAEMWGDMKDWLNTGYINGDIRSELTCRLFDKGLENQTPFTQVSRLHYTSSSERVCIVYYPNFPTTSNIPTRNLSMFYRWGWCRRWCCR